MTALYQGIRVRVYRTKRNRSQIAYQGMLRWVKTSELEVLALDERGAAQLLDQLRKYRAAQLGASADAA